MANPLQTLQGRLPVALIAFCILLVGETFQPDDVKILGDLEYGQSSGVVDYSPTPRFSAFLFSGLGGDQVDITVKGDARKALVVLADGALKQLASGTTHLSFQLPDKGPDAEAYYILFRDAEGKAARFTVDLKNLHSNRRAAK